jgi:hypothetical protein
MFYHVPKEIRAHDILSIGTYNMRQLLGGNHQESSFDSIESCSMSTVSQKDWASAANESRVQGIFKFAWINWGDAVWNSSSKRLIKAEKQQNCDNGLRYKEEESGDLRDDKKGKEHRGGERKTERIKYTAQKDYLRTEIILETTSKPRDRGVGRVKSR